MFLIGFKHASRQGDFFDPGRATIPPQSTALSRQDLSLARGQIAQLLPNTAADIIMSGIEKKYLNIMIFNRFLWCIISLICCIISIKYIGFVEQFSYIIYISTLFLWAVIFSLTGISFKRKKYVFRDHDLMYSSGVIFTSTVLIPYNRIQHLAIHQGFLSRVSFPQLLIIIIINIITNK